MIMLLSDMQKAIDRIKLAIDQNERILVYGDYDADGVTSTTILVSTFTSTWRSGGVVYSQ